MISARPTSGSEYYREGLEAQLLLLEDVSERRAGLKTFACARCFSLIPCSCPNVTVWAIDQVIFRIKMVLQNLVEDEDIITNGY